MNIFVEGFACLGSFGSGADSLISAIRAVEAGQAANFAQRADVSRLGDFFPARSLRQCDRFSRLALLGASLALEDAGLSPADLGNCGVVLATGYGPTTPTLDFLDSILAHGEQMASPLAFSLSVHNIPAAIVAKSLQIQGPCATVCQYESAVASGFMLASQWLQEGRVERVLLGAVDEYTDLLASISGRLARLHQESGLREGRRALPLGEGAAFFLLSGAKNSPAARIAALSLQSIARHETPPLPEDLPCFVSGAAPQGALARCGVIDASKAYGNIPIAAALDSAVAMALMREPESAFSRCCCRNYGFGVWSEILWERIHP